MNVLHEFIDELLRVHPTPFIHSPPFILLHRPEYSRVRGARAVVSVMLRVLGALSTVSLLAGLTAVAHRGLALGGGVAGVTGVACVLSVDVLQCQRVVFHSQRWHRGAAQPREGQLAVQLRASGGLLAGQEDGLVPGQRPEEREDYDII